MTYAGGVDYVIFWNYYNFKLLLKLLISNLKLILNLQTFYESLGYIDLFFWFMDPPMLFSRKKKYFFHKNFIFISFADVTIFYWLF